MTEILSRPRAILFDLDGVLITSLENHFFTWRTVLADHGITLTRRDIALGEGEKAEVSMRRFFIEKAGITPPDDLVEDLVNRKRRLYRENSPPRIIPEAHELLQRLKAAGVLLGLVTGSARVNLQSSLTADEISLFDAIVSGEENLPGKPDPAPYLTAMQRLQCEPQSCWIVENAPFGIQAAKAAGGTVIALQSTLTKVDLPGADYYIEHISEVGDIFSKVNVQVERK